MRNLFYLRKNVPTSKFELVDVFQYRLLFDLLVLVLLMLVVLVVPGVFSNTVIYCPTNKTMNKSQLFLMLVINNIKRSYLQIQDFPALSKHFVGRMRQNCYTVTLYLSAVIDNDQRRRRNRLNLKLILERMM